MLMKLNVENFEKEVLQAQGLALVDFYADWCGPCKMVAPVLEEIAQEREDVLIGKINVDESGILAAKYQVVNIPTMILFKDGKEQGRIIGFRPKDDILQFIG
ncbi:MAG: thioredoxin [Oscillospiraceae bacterium]|nr:thioredoxin [Oscillospiraceae bacterium]